MINTMLDNMERTFRISTSAAQPKRCQYAGPTSPDQSPFHDNTLEFIGCMPSCKSRMNWVILSMSLVVFCSNISDEQWRRLKMSSILSKYSYTAWYVIPNRLPMALRSIRLGKNEDSKYPAFGREHFLPWRDYKHQDNVIKCQSLAERSKSWFWLLIMGAGWRRTAKKIQEILANRNHARNRRKEWPAVHRNCQCPWTHATLFWRSLPYPRSS